ncbi:hypothetical protein RUM44_001484 [Polyplax serrata]|uniref:Thiamine transporter 2 n=1 Tax=Polyplax serrata TaxID=468196 RepID=A0ABR1AK58_POLSC
MFKLDRLENLKKFGNILEIFIYMPVLEFFYGYFMASEVAYFTYIYAKVDKAHYQKVTGHARTAFLLGKAGAGLSSQLFVYWDVLDYLQLNYVTAAEQGLDGVTDMNKTVTIELKSKESQEITLKKTKYRTAFLNLYEDCKQAFTNRYVLQWSIWWALATCGLLQITAYSQLLWEEIIKFDDTIKLLNGYVECITSLLGAAVTFSIGYLKVPWNKYGEFFLGVLTITQGCILVYCSLFENVYAAYIVHIAYQILYHAAITVASYEVAKYIREHSYALIFGINTFLALILQTLLTAIVIFALKTSIRDQFMVYGGYHISIGAGFLLIGIVTMICFKNKSKMENP